MDQNQTNEEESSAKGRILRLFKFLHDVNRLRYRPERTLQDQVLVIPLTKLPEHPSIQLTRPVMTDGQTPAEFDLSVARARTTRCAPPPDLLRDWLVSGWDDPNAAAAYEDSRNEVTEQGESITVKFDADPARLIAWERWTATRKAWVAPEMRARAALAFFEKLYGLYALLEKDSERLELMVADGILNWETQSLMEQMDVKIHHPVLLKRVELSFDPAKPEFRVIETERGTELYASLLIDLEGLNASGLDARQRELASADYHPMGFADSQAFLTALVQTISPVQGVFLEAPPHAGFERHPRLWREPVLLVRRRIQGVTNAVSRIIDDIEQREVFPPAFGQIVGMPQEWKSAADAVAQQSPENIPPDTLMSTTIPAFDDSEILLAKEANSEQLQIIRKLANAGSVLVQGPPGTGKTHTIANIVGHLLAQGKTVLVTSHTPKALRVLREQIPEALRPLCVSAVSGDRESQRQLEAAISEINARLSRSSPETLRAQIEQRVQERRKILEENSHLTRMLREALESEYQPISSHGHPVTPANAARHVKDHFTQSQWLPGPIKQGVAVPLPVNELAALYDTNNRFDVMEEHDATCLLPTLDGLLPVPRLRSLVAEIDSLATTDLAFKSELWGRGAAVNSEHVAALLADFATEFSDHYRKIAWRPYVIVAGIQGGTHRTVWETLSAKIMEASELSAQYSLSLAHRPKLSTKISIVKQCETLQQILLHLGSGGKLGLVQLITKAEWRHVITTASVAAGRPEREEHFRALSLLASLERLRDEIEGLWDKLIAGHGGNRFRALGAEPEQAARPLVQEIDRCLNWHKTIWMRLIERLNSCGLELEKALGSTPREPSLISDYDLAERASVEILPPILEAHIRRLRLRECEAEIAAHTSALLAMGEERGAVGSLLRALNSKDALRYEEAVNYTRRLHEISPIVKHRKALLERLGKAAPAWAAAISNRIAPNHGPLMPGDSAVAWNWRQLHDELDRRSALNAQTLQREIDHNRKVLRDITTSLIDMRAWVNQIERVEANHSVRQALVGWLDTIKRMKSTQKKDMLWRLQTEARKLMRLSAKAVPVWIMPLAVAAENFDPATSRFDVVIIDEASQADLNALVAVYQGDKVIIVGDHEQVTPEAVGKAQDLIHNLIDTHIRDIPNSRLFDNRSSIYDIARQSFGDGICLLEHFRCVPEIIAFSNRLSYDGRIRPLRESNSTFLKPACVAYRVNGVAQNQVNHKEAETIADLIKAMCKHPVYVGKTIGVISMVGENQANLIDTKLRKELDPVDYEQRRIICGNSAQFQGDERHVIFLSMIDSGKEHGLGPIAKKGDGAYDSTKKRYNVAASRAQDQLWVVHSLDPNNDLKPGDLRRELILHAQNPMSTINLFKQEAPRTESEFERQVLRILTNKGYKVRSQWSVGYYRIDMVVEGDGKRLAVECDGDRWHPIEKLADDMARQAILERLGWMFTRIRGSAFFRDEEQAMRPVFERLDELGIAPWQPIGGAIEDDALVKELEAIVAKFHEEGEDGLDEPTPAEVAIDAEVSGGPRSKPDETNESSLSGGAPKVGVEDPPLPVHPSRVFDVSFPPRPGNGSVKADSLFAEYVACEGVHVDDPRTVSVEVVSDGLCRIVEVEGPMVAKRAYDIYLRGCGIKRLGHDLKSTMNRALQIAIRQQRVCDEDEAGSGDQLLAVIRSVGSPPIKLRTRGERAFEEIPPSELQTVARYLEVRCGMLPGSDDHLRAILDSFDLKRLTTQVGTSLLEILDRSYPYVDEFLNRMDQ